MRDPNFGHFIPMNNLRALCLLAPCFAALLPLAASAATGDWDTFNTSVANEVYCTAIQADGKLLMGGYFTSPRNRLARYNTDGTLDSAFNIGPDDWQVDCIAVQTNAWTCAWRSRPYQGFPAPFYLRD